MRIYAVGDIHGMHETLEEVLFLIDQDIKQRPPAGDVLEIFLGDYVDRGPDSFGVLEALLSPTPEDRRRACLLGNHEDAMLSAMNAPEMEVRWMPFGGAATCRSYGIDADGLAHNPKAIQTQLQAAVPEHHRRFLSALPRSLHIGDHLFVHAGIRPKVAMDAQNPHDLIWIREPFLSYGDPHPAHIVHGHTPVSMPDHRAHRTNIDTAAVYGGALTAAVFEGDSVRFLSVETTRHA